VGLELFSSLSSTQLQASFVQYSSALQAETSAFGHTPIAIAILFRLLQPPSKQTQQTPSATEKRSKGFE
jgi:hypothetical protein